MRRSFSGWCASGFQLAGVARVAEVADRRGWWGPKGGGPKFCVFPLSRPIFAVFFSLGGLFVELWPRVAAVDHPNCAFGLLWGYFVRTPAAYKPPGPAFTSSWTVRCSFLMPVVIKVCSLVEQEVFKRLDACDQGSSLRCWH